LEGRYQVDPPELKPPASESIQAIVVLASEVLPPTALRATAIPAWDTYQRCEHAAWLYKNRLHVPVLASGRGNAGKDPYADTMRLLLEQQGVPSEMIWTEDQSMSTYESARDSAEILRKRGVHEIALVTEAFHMPRSEFSFRKQGLTVIPAACCFRTDPDDSPGLLPSAKAINWNEDTMHELLGLLWYRMQGRI
jgi:uncharacterized SAM-binding protein YcdF (DUF218 family)